MTSTLSDTLDSHHSTCLYATSSGGCSSLFTLNSSSLPNPAEMPISLSISSRNEKSGVFASESNLVKARGNPHVSSPNHNMYNTFPSPQVTASPAFSDDKPILLDFSPKPEPTPSSLLLSPSPSPPYTSPTSLSFSTPQSTLFTHKNTEPFYSMDGNADIIHTACDMSPPNFYSFSECPREISPTNPTFRSSSSRRKSAWPVSAAAVARMPGITFILDVPICPHMPRIHFPYDPEASDDDLDYYCIQCASGSSDYSRSLNEHASPCSKDPPSSPTYSVNNSDSEGISCSSPVSPSFNQALSHQPYSRSSSPFSDTLSSGTDLSFSQCTFAWPRRDETESAFIDSSSTSTTSENFHSKKGRPSSMATHNLRAHEMKKSLSPTINSSSLLDSDDAGDNIFSNRSSATPILTPPLTPMSYHVLEPHVHSSASVGASSSSFPTSASFSSPFPSVQGLENSRIHNPKAEILSMKKSHLVPNHTTFVPEQRKSTFSNCKSPISGNSLAKVQGKSILSKRASNKVQKKSTDLVLPFSSTVYKKDKLLAASRTLLLSKPIHIETRQSPSQTCGATSQPTVFTDTESEALDKKVESSPAANSWRFDEILSSNDSTSISSSSRPPSACSTLSFSSPSPSLSRESTPDIVSKGSFTVSASPPRKPPSFSPRLFQHLCYSCQNDFLSEVPASCPLSARPIRANRQQKHLKPDLCPVCTDLFQRHGLRCTACYFVPAENVVESGQVKCERCFGGTYTCDRL